MSFLTGNAPLLPDYQPAASPGNPLLDRQRRVPKLAAKLPQRFFSAFAEVAAVDHHVVLISDWRSDPLAKEDRGTVPA